MPLPLGAGQWLHEMVQSAGPSGLGQLTCQYLAGSVARIRIAVTGNKIGDPLSALARALPQASFVA